MLRRLIAGLGIVALWPIVGFAAPPEGVEQFMTPAMEQPVVVTPLTFMGSSISGFGESQPKPKKEKQAKVKPIRPDRPAGMALGPERARILLRSLTVPGWGQATMGHRRSAGVFAVAEAGVWGAFSAFRIQENLRTQNYQRTARYGAGIELSDRDEEFLRIVGAFANSDEYNLLVVSRDAANQYLSDPYNPDIAGYRQYIAEHSLRGADAWSWDGVDSFRRYSAQRKDAQRAALRANTALGIAIANRIVSALHAMRIAGQPPRVETRSWQLDVTPDPQDPTAFRAGVRARF
ncbi:MAG: hypothetical protein ABIU54_03350 [Candidatus Eisenbacteria bacterium]